MIEQNGEMAMGMIEVATSQNGGHSAEFWAERCTNRICGISETAEGHIRQQAQEFRLAIYETILYHIKNAINSERCTMRNSLSAQGHEDLAKILKEL